MSTSHHRFVILGAGPTGLGAAYRLRELGQHDFIVLEKEASAGGLARSFVDDAGFTWDIGGHVQFSHYKYFDELMHKALGVDGWLNHQREAWAWMRERFVPYPVQNNLRHFPPEVMFKCLAGLVQLYKSPPSSAPKNFREWIFQTFGPGLAEEFMLPYNYKVWAVPPEDMGWGWVGERVAVTDLERVLKGVVFAQDDVSWGPNNTFQFPKRGGTGAIWSAVAHLVGLERFRFGSTVSHLDPQRRRVTLKDGHVVEYESLISTLPVDLLVGMLDSPSNEHLAAKKLVHSSTNVIGLGLSGQPKESLATKCWLYFNESNCPFYRATVFSNYSPNHVPRPGEQWSLMTETSESAKKPVDVERLIEATIDGALNTQLIRSKEQVVSTWAFRAEYGYPTPSVERDQHLNKVLPALEAQGIYSRGRFGAWKYEVSNQDHSLMQGVEVINRLVLQVPETTLPYPNTANANWGKRV